MNCLGRLFGECPEVVATEVSPLPCHQISGTTAEHVGEERNDQEDGTCSRDDEECRVDTLNVRSMQPSQEESPSQNEKGEDECSSTRPDCDRAPKGLGAAAARPHPMNLVDDLFVQQTVGFRRIHTPIVSR